MDPDTCSITIKDLKPRQRNRRHGLWKALAKLDLKAYKMDEAKGGFKITTDSRTTEKLLQQKSKNTFHTYGFTPLTPLDYNARRTLLARLVDVHIAGASKEEIITSIEDNNIGIKAEDVIHIPGSPKLLKIRFENIEMARDAKEYGLLIMNQLFRPALLEQEIYIKLEPCFNCFKYSHKTSNCPTPELVVCSECGERGHLFPKCPNNFKRCLNCNQEHRTLAASCNIRKKLIKEKTKETLENRKKTPIEQEKLSNNEPSPLPFNALAVIYTAIIYSSCEEMATPGTFQAKMDSIYGMNGLPAVRVPTPKDPRLLLRAIQATHSAGLEETNQPQEHQEENHMGKTVEELRNLSEVSSSQLNLDDLSQLGCSTIKNEDKPSRRKQRRPRRSRGKNISLTTLSESESATVAHRETDDDTEDSYSYMGETEEKKQTRMTSTPTDEHRGAAAMDMEETTSDEEPLQLKNRKCFWTHLREAPSGILLTPRSECRTPEYWGMRVIGKEIYKPKEGVTYNNQQTLWNFGALAMYLDPSTTSEATFGDMLICLMTGGIVFDKITWLDTNTYDTFFKQQWTPRNNQDR